MVAGKSLDFKNMKTCSLLLLCFRGVRAFFAVKAKQQLYEAHLNRLYLLHNLNNNAGVISQCLDEANEQVGMDGECSRVHV